MEKAPLFSVENCELLSIIVNKVIMNINIITILIMTYGNVKKSTDVNQI